MKEKIKKILWFFANPKLLLCLGIAWTITNGWSYIFLAIGTAFGIGWMAAIGGTYLTFLWIPATPEKIITLIIAIFLLKKLFPNDQKTLKILEDLFEKVKIAEREAREKRKAKREARKAESQSEIKATSESEGNGEAMGYNDNANDNSEPQNDSNSENTDNECPRLEDSEQ